MKKIVYLISGLLMMSFVACGGGTNSAPKGGEEAKTAEATGNVSLDIATVPLNDSVSTPMEFPVDKDGFITVFDGKTFNGWRGYGKENVPGKWVIEDGCIKFNGSGAGEAQDGQGGDLIFAHKFRNFELQLEWKISKGGNSGIFYLAQEVQTTDAEGKTRIEPIYISAPEFQVLDNENHPDAKMGVNNNRKAASLYDMIPAVPQEAKPHDEWNKARIMVYKGTVVHGQNDKDVVVEYHLWTQQWTDMLQASKFSKEKWPIAFELLNNCGGADKKGYIGLQDHGDDVWYRSIKVKILD